MDRPAVGTVVTVVVRNLMRFKPVYVPLWGHHTVESPETFTFTGTVTKSDPWMKIDEFNLTTGLSHFPIRTISLKNVVQLGGAIAEAGSSDESTEYVEVPSSKGDKTYTVVVRNGVGETCTCPAFQFRGGRCKHLAMATGAAPVQAAVKPKKTVKRSSS